ncbi:protein mono-ADP-ribosyltransferase PARP16-like [Lineus longissimus]|uniref:protein mono-ADP-ribosyltransferase PARP16-like n=1 Tax=Lineus longissimus TaxID=88925 RepID=UPI002B4ED814
MERDDENDQILERVQADMASADFQFSLLVAALSSYRHDTVLRPFPSNFINRGNNSKDYQGLEQTVDRSPSLRSIKSISDVDDRVKDLLSWTINNKTLSLWSCGKQKYDEIKSLTGETVYTPPPDYVFEVRYNDQINAKFQELQQDYDLKYAYHGSRLENFHSILHNGLHSHMNKNSLFGEGTYLSSELSVTMPYCPTGKAWGKSQIGDQLGCVAVCEIIDHPSVKCQTGTSNGASGSNQQRQRSRVAGSMGGDVPEKYYIVQNNELLRIKYVLVYAQHSQRSFRNSWCYQHRFALLMMSYVVMLLAVALLSNKNLNAYLRRMWR